MTLTSFGWLWASCIVLWSAWVQGAFFLWLAIPVYIVLKYRYIVNINILLFDYKHIVTLDVRLNIEYNAHIKWVIIWPVQRQLSSC